MKRFILILTAALLAATTAHAITWWKTFGGPGYDVGNCVQITSDGNYIIAGKEDGDLWLLKVDTLGNLIWSKTYGRSEGHQTRWIEPTNDGGYVIAAWTPSLVKANGEGDTLWTKDYGMRSYCVEVTSDGGYIVLGGNNGYEADKNLILVKTDSEGDTLWTRTYGDPSRNRNSGFFIQRTSDGGYIITGATGEESEEFATKYLWLIKTNSDGDTVWTREYGTGGIGEFNKGYCVRQTSDGGYIITGHKYFPPRGLWLLKTDSLGDTLWTKTYRTSLGGTGYSVQETHDGGYIVVGTTQNISVALDLAGAGFWFIKTNAQGGTLWTRVYSGDGADIGRCVQQTSDLGYVAVGYTFSYGAGGSDVYLLKTDSLGLLSIEEEPIPETPQKWNITASLNSQIVLHYSDCPDGLQISVFDACGREMDALYAVGSSGTLSWGENYPAGVYFIQVNNNNQTRTTRVVLVH